MRLKTTSRYLALAGITIALATGAGVIAMQAGHGAHGAALSVEQDQHLQSAIANPARSAANRARDAHRHPYETLKFFGVRPTDTVVELFPGGGWYSEILGPYVATRGTYVVAAPWENGLRGFRRLQASSPDPYRHAVLAEFPVVAGSSNPIVTAGSADFVLTFRNVHNWRFGAANNAGEAFRQIATMLKPGGHLGVVEHRLPENMDSALEQSSGYMKTSSVIAFAEAAGLRLVAQSEINANPRDTHDYPGGVWTLPPTYADVTDDADRARRTAIGESDRMTLLFVKPAG